MKRLIYLTILVATNTYAQCRVAGNDIVCDNSNTLIETYNALIRPVQPLVNVYINNQTTNIIDNNFTFDLLQEKRFDFMQKLQNAPSNSFQVR